MTDPYPSIVDLLPAGRIIVICGRADDALAWQDLLGPDRCLAIALDTAPANVRGRVLRGATDQLAWQHDTIAGLDRSGWLSRAADAFDPDRSTTLLIPDPLDPPVAGSRRRFGRRHPAWRTFEDKTVVDALWDVLGVPRAPSIVADGLRDLATLGALVDQGTGVVCSCQPLGAGPSAGGDGIWWWHDRPPATMPTVGAERWRVRLMPLLEGMPVRLHGLTSAQQAVAFPPMEIVALPRPDRGTFLCAGAVPTLGDHSELLTLTEHIGTALLRKMGYRGAFSIDGILTADGFLPTDFNARLTSATEAAPAPLRVQLHATNLLAREAAELNCDEMRQIIDWVFGQRSTYTLYGAATTATMCGLREVSVRWELGQLTATDNLPSHGKLAVVPSARGWLLIASLTSDHVPDDQLGSLAPHVFRLSDQILGTDFGDLLAPFNTAETSLPSAPCRSSACSQSTPAR